MTESDGVYEESERMSITSFAIIHEMDGSFSLASPEGEGIPKKIREATLTDVYTMCDYVARVVSAQLFSAPEKKETSEREEVAQTLQQKLDERKRRA